MAQEVPKLSLLSALLNAKKLFRNPIGVVNESMKTFKTETYRAPLGMRTEVIMSQNPRIANHVLKKNHKNYHKSEIQSEILARFIGKGLLTSNGEYWLKQRRLIQPGFHKKNLHSFMAIMNEEIMHFVEQWKIKYPGQTNTINLSAEMAALTMRVVSRALFSTEVDDKEIQFIGTAIDQLQVAINKDIRLPFLRAWRKLNGEEKSNTKTANKLYDLLRKKIELRRQGQSSEGDLLDMLLNVRYEETGEGMTEQQLIDEILVLYAAGYETTANSLAWTFKALDEHPEVLRHLVQEIDSAKLGTELNMEDLMQFPFTKKIIAESLRFYPPAWIIDRLALEDDEVDGVKIKKGEIVNLYIYGMHHSEKYWDSPEQFNPDRFDDPSAFKNSAYLPFGGGPRLCIGFQFANLEITLALYHILKNYKLSLVPNQKIEMNPLVTLKSKKGIKMELGRRY